MSQTVNVFSTVIGGKLSNQARQVIINALAKLEGLEAHITIRARKEKRTLDQLALYRAAVLPSARMAYMDMGTPMSIEMTHEALLHMFAPTISIPMLDGTVEIKPKRTRETGDDPMGMDKDEMTAFINAITAQLAAFGYSIERQQ
jgi:hypothetical protein